MSITCAVCCTNFQKIIPWQHLKKHGITTEEYKKQHGPVYSAETLEKLQARIPHNKGKKISDPEQLAVIRSAIEKREQRYQQGEFRRGKRKTSEEKKVLSEKTRDYARLHPEEMRQRAKKAINTKRQKNYDFGKTMRGKKHRKSSRKIISEKSKIANQKKSQQANQQIFQRISELNLTLKNTLSDWNLDLRCNTCHNDFSFTKQYFYLSKIKHTICPTCYPRNCPTSQKEKALYDFVKSLWPSAINSYRSHYHNREIDVFVPELNIGFEFNGLYWHSESVLLHNNKSAKSDYEKQQEFARKGIRLVQIFEDEWDGHADIVKSRIANILSQTKTRIPARACALKEISSRDAAQFCDQNHIMGRGRSNRRFGLYFKDHLVSVMTFSQDNISRKVHHWELNRYSSLIDTVVVGGASRLLQAFIKSVNPDLIVSFSDNRWSDGGLYQQLGFEKIHNGSPNYWYVLPNVSKRIHRYSLRKTENDNQSITEKQLRSQQGYDRIWDSGSSRWEWTKENRA